MFEGPNPPREEENVTMTAGFGFFPPIALLLASFDLSSGESGQAPLDIVTTKQIGIFTGIVIVFLGFCALIL
jgi:hypothetical protein